MIAWWKALFRNDELDIFFPDRKIQPVKYFLFACIRFTQSIVLGLLIGIFLMAGALALLGNGSFGLKILGLCLIVCTVGGLVWLQIDEGSSRRSE